MTTETIDDYGYNSKTGEYQLFPLLPDEKRLLKQALNGFSKAAKALKQLETEHSNTFWAIKDFFVSDAEPLHLACWGEGVCDELFENNEPVKRRRCLRRKHG